ncbi:hypothetical protein C8R47DRAFT_1091766 [Mycena vitilis]|nr:hypothetical protein C8R47DRAFT_1091766 [Mycena vitilis]
MALWLQRQEAIALRSSYLLWLKSPPTSDDSDTDSDDDEPARSSVPMVVVRLPPTNLPTTSYKIAKSPVKENVSVGYLQTAHGADTIIPALTAFLKLHFKSCPIIPAVLPKGRSPGSPAIFDTALVIEDPSLYVPSSGIAGLRPAQIRAIFKLPPQFGTYAHPLAYIEWFTPLNRPDLISGMFSTQRSTRNHQRNSAVISVHQIVRACHLMAKCGSTINPKCFAAVFYVNPYILVDTFTRQRIP